jgi:hypothetical protein
VVLIVHYKFMHLIIHFNPSATQLFPYTSILSLRFNFLTEMPVARCSQQHRFLIAAHSLQHFQGPNQEIIFLQSPHYHESCRLWAKCSMHSHVVYRALPWSYSLPHVGGQQCQ